MILKVKHNELKDVANTLTKDSEAYDTEITNMLNSINTLKEIWQGDDATEFCDKVTEYLSNMSNIPIAMRNMSNAITTIDNGYEAFDETFSNSLIEEETNDDE